MFAVLRALGLRVGAYSALLHFQCFPVYPILLHCTDVFNNPVPAVEMQDIFPSQYQHYIPQFLLRRFALAPAKKRSKKPRRNEVVNPVDLAKDIPELDTLPVKRIFGQVDMYKDNLKFTLENQMRIGQKLCNIEQAASRIIAKVVDAEKAGKSDFSLSAMTKTCASFCSL